MSGDDKTTEEELIELKEKIDSQIDDIKSNSDEETLEKMKGLYDYLEKKNKLPTEEDSDEEKIKKLKKANKVTSFYQGLQNNISFDPGRLMGLTDGIFSIVMTLLVFGMALPDAHFLTEGDFIAFIHSIGSTFWVTLLSFILIASFWIYHHEFVKIDKLNFPFLWMNILFLACISFIPFTTSLIGTYSKFFAADFIFFINIILTAVFFTLLFWYADKRNLLENKLSKAEKKYIYNTFYLIMAFSVIVIFLVYFVSSDFIYLFFLVPIITTVRDIDYKIKHNI